MRDKNIDMQYANFLRRYIDLSDDQMNQIVQGTPIESFKKGTVLLKQGERETHCIFVLKGCLRQYMIDEDGNEVTSEFYTEEQWVNVFNSNSKDNVSKYFLSCVEDSVLIYSLTEDSDKMLSQFSELSNMTNTMMGEKIGEVNEAILRHTSMSNEERVRSLMTQRPDLFTRVPQHQLASYLGIKPESLSRIKKRIEKEDA